MTDTGKPIVSYIIPMYNAEAYIEKCIRSLLHQSFRGNEFEIIVINDGSSDMSFTVVDTLQRDIPQIRLLTQENRGLSVTRNRGIDLAQGTYILFVDADDLLIPRSVKRIVEVASENRLDVLAFEHISGLIPEIYTYPRRSDPRTQLEVMNGLDYVAQHNFYNGSCFYLINTEYLKSNGFRFVENKLCEDSMFTPEILLHAQRVGKLDTDVYYYIVRQNSILTTTNRDRVLKLIDDMLYVANYQRSLIAFAKGEGAHGASRRIASRQSALILFALIRAFKIHVKAERIKEYVAWLKSNQLYPFVRPLKAEYPGNCYTVLNWVANREWLLYLFFKFNPIRGEE